MLPVKEAADQCRNNRQCCTGSKRFIIHNSLKEEFIRRLIEEYLSKEVQGDPMDPRVTMGPMISERAAQEVEKTGPAHRFPGRPDRVRRKEKRGVF